MATLNGEWPPPETIEAVDVTYDNAASGLAATDVQAALDELAAGAGADAGAVLTFGAQNIGAGAGTAYMPPGYENGTVSPGPLYSYEIPRDGVLKSLHVATNSNAGNGTVVTYRIQVNSGAPSALLVQLATGMSGEAANLVDEVPVSQGDRIDLRVEKPATIGNAALYAICSVELAAAP